MKRWIVSAFCIGAAVCATAAHAHHSIAGVYDNNQRVTVEGVITRFQFVNPHPWVSMEVRDANGNVQQWTLEMDNRHELVDIGFDNVTLRSGDRIVVTGSPGRRQPQSLYIRKLERPADGFSYEQVGSSPSISRPASRRRN